jgi:uncharacterized membrane protein
MGNWTPSIVPSDDQTVYLVVDDFGKHGRAWRETDVEATDLETVIGDLLNDQYNNPVRVVGFNTSEGWSRDVSEDIAHELRRRSDFQRKDLPEGLILSAGSKLVIGSSSRRALCRGGRAAAL